MTTQQTSAEAHTRLANFISADIKKLVKSNGRIKEGNFEFTLKTPSVTDAHLKAIINEPTLEIRSIGNQTTIGEMYFDLKAYEKHVRVKVLCNSVASNRK